MPVNRMRFLDGQGLQFLASQTPAALNAVQNAFNSVTQQKEGQLNREHQSRENAKQRKAQEDAKKKAEKEKKKALATSLGIGAGTAVVGAGLGAALAPALAATPAAGAGVVAPTTAGLESAGTVATGEAIAQSAATAAGATTVGAVPATLSAPLATAGLTAGQTSGLAGSIGAIGAGGAAAGGAGTGALIGGGAGFAGGTGAGINAQSPQEAGIPNANATAPQARSFSQPGQQPGPAVPTYAGTANQAAEAGGYGIRDGGDRLKLFGLLAGKNLLNTFAPGSGNSLDPVLSSPAYDYGSAIRTGNALTNTAISASNAGRRAEVDDSRIRANDARARNYDARTAGVGAQASISPRSFWDQFKATLGPDGVTGDKARYIRETLGAHRARWAKSNPQELDDLLRALQGIGFYDDSAGAGYNSILGLGGG